MRGFVLGVIGSRGRGLGGGERGLNSLGEGGSGGPRRTRWLGGGGPQRILWLGGRGGEVDEIGGGGPRRILWLGRGRADGIGREKAALRFRGSCELLPNSLADWDELEPLIGGGSR